MAGPVKELSYEDLDKKKKDVQAWYSYFNENLEQYRTDVRFVHGDQFTEEEQSEFIRLHKPLFQANKLYPIIKQLIGDMRQYTPNIGVRDESGTHEQSQVDLYSNLLREIAYHSDNDIVYQTAGECGLKGGFGAFRILTEYENTNSFDLKITYEACPDPTICFWDPNATKLHKQDGDFCGIYEILDEETFKKLYPNVDVSDINDSELFVSGSSTSFSWLQNRGGKKVIVVVDYYFKEYFNKTIVLLSNGAIVEGKHLDDYKRQFIKDSKSQGSIRPKLTDIERRTVKDHTIKHYKLCGAKILEEATFPGRALPLIFVPGDTYYDNGQQYTVSLIRYVRDLQRYLNYLQSDMAHGIMLLRREQFIGTPENISSQELAEIWKNPANVQGMLLANRDTAGMLPQKLPPSEIPQSEILQYNMTEKSIQTSLGMYEAVRGEVGNETSGVAIGKKIQQSNTTNYIHFDNLKRAISYGAKVALGMFPEVYINERYVKVTTREGQSEVKRINYLDKETGHMVNFLGEREFSVEVKAGSPFLMQKQEAFGQLMSLAQASPEVFPIIGDLLAKNLDIENSDQISKRLQTLVPPAILAKEKDQPAPPPMPNPQEELAHAEAQAATKKAQAVMIQAEASMIKAQHEVQGSQQQHMATMVKSRAEMAKALLSYNEHLATMASDQEKQRLQQENMQLKSMFGI